MGWLGAAIPEEHGGLGPRQAGTLRAGRRDGPRGCADPVFLDALLLCRSADARRQRRAEGRAAAEGRRAAGRSAALRLSEGPGAPTASHIARKFDGSTLSGAKIPVTDGDIATHAVVSRKRARALSLVLVDLNQAGRHAQDAEDARSHARPCQARVRRTRTPNASARQGEGWALNAAGAGPRGGADRVRTGRRRSGLPRHGDRLRQEPLRVLAPDRRRSRRSSTSWPTCMSTIEVARSNAYYGAWALSTDAAELPFAAAAARVAASDAYYFAAKENIQTHGGMGFTWEVDCHLFYRRAKLLAVQAGSPTVWKEKLVRGSRRRMRPDAITPANSGRRDFSRRPSDAGSVAAFFNGDSCRRAPEPFQVTESVGVCRSTGVDVQRDRSCR